MGTNSFYSSTETKVFASVTTPHKNWGEIHILSHPGLQIGFDGTMFIDPFERAEYIAKMKEAKILSHVVLPPAHELPHGAFQQLQLLSEKSGIDTSHFSIDDFSIPSREQQRIWLDVSPKLIQKLSEGHAIAFSCLSGVGRSPCMAARLLFELGISGECAIAEVRKAVEGAVETESQLEWISGKIDAGNSTDEKSDHRPE